MEILRKNTNVIAIIILFAVGFSLYAVNLNNELFWDDNDWIVNNPDVHSLSGDNISSIFSHSVLGGVGLESNYYRPFLFTTFAFNYSISETNPISYHIVNNGLHILNGILIFFLISWLLKRKSVGFIVALIFVIHPLQTEAVTYIAGRGDSLHLFFMLCAMMIFYVSEKRNLGWLSLARIGSYLLFILGLLSQEKAIILPALLLVTYMAFMDDNRFFRTLSAGLKKVSPYVFIAIVYFILRLTILNFADTLNLYSVPTIYSENLSIRLYTFMHVLLVYYRLLLVPTGLHMERSIEIHQTPFSTVVLLSSGLIIALVYFLYRFYKARPSSIRDRVVSGVSNYNIWFFGVLWFFVSLGPVSGIIPINAVLYEHWLYIALIGPATIVAWYILKLWDVNKEKRSGILGLMVILVVLYVSFFSVQTYRRNSIWGDPIKFYSSILEFEPKSTRINNNLGTEFYDIGDKEKARIYYELAAQGGSTFAQPSYNLGNLYHENGEFKEAIISFQAALTLDPSFYFAKQKLVELYSGLGDFPRAVELIEELKRERPKDPQIFYNAALIYQFLEDSQLALSNAQQALDIAISIGDNDMERDVKELLTQL